MPTKIAAPDINDLVGLNEGGKTLEEIAVIYGVHVLTVRKWFRLAGVKARRDLGGSHQLTPERRREVVAAATAANRGRTRSGSALAKRAQTAEARQLNISPLETRLASMLQDVGVEVIQQKAVGPYNIDIAIGSIAVEVFGGNWHNTHRQGKRLRYLLDRGWSVIIIWVDTGRYALSSGAAEYIIAHVELAQLDPPSTRGYRVIRGSGELFATGGPDTDGIPDKLTPGYRLDLPKTVPYGTCHCGCGQQTWVASRTDRRRGWVKGEPVKWIVGHNSRGSRYTIGQDGRRNYTR